MSQRFWYALAVAFFHGWFPLRFRWRVRGREQVPREGGIIVCCNHRNHWDPPLVGSASPRQLRFMAKQELFGVPFLGRAIRAVGAFAVRRGEADREALRHALRLLEAGEAVGVFPEGTRSPDGSLRAFHDGAALLALKSGCPVVPARIDGAYTWGGRITVTFGAPFSLSAAGEGRRADLKQGSNEISRRIASLQQQESTAREGK
ncbi:MAG: lysophospholipid acyltransferase family protein [Thermaerobacter sp.]|nr:lysophospholipid acyltransferase family protein [Thermaerobacter sp.]